MHNDEKIFQVPFIRKGLVYFLYLSTKSMGTTTSKLSQIFENVAMASNTELNTNALRKSVKRFVENFKETGARPPPTPILGIMYVKYPEFVLEKPSGLPQSCLRSYSVA